MYLWTESLYATPEVMKLLTGALATHLGNQAQKRQEPPGNSAMSGAQAYLTYAPYLGCELPDPGYARLIWDPSEQ